MKYFYAINILFFLTVNIGISQTQSEKKKIIETYNKEEVSSLQSFIDRVSNERNLRVENFLTQNPSVDRNKVIEGQSYQIFDVLDGEPIYRTVDNVNSAIATRTNFLHNGGGLGLNLEGQNMNLGVWEEHHARNTHVEFSNGTFPPASRVTLADYNSGSSEFSDHATHVSGTLIARGADAFAKGMAPQASLVCYDWNNDSNEVEAEIQTNALLISNQSYGVPIYNSQGGQNAPTWMMGCYNIDAQLWDAIAYTYPYYLQVLSAGNDGQSTYTGGVASGYDKLTGDKNAKNNLVVANAANPSVSSEGDLLSLTINSSSSQGPSDDGRVKPDIAGDGTSVYSSTSGSNTSYGTFTGTSMASPNVAGSLLLLQQYYNSLHGQFLKAATLKGLVCHTADDDSSKPGPDPFFGWGLLNSKRAAEVIQEDTSGGSLISELVLNQGEMYTKSFTTTGGSPLQVTICWTDPPGGNQSGSLNSTVPALVNDLDVRLKDPGGFIIHMPWKLLIFNINSPAIKGDNVVDNIERIDVDAPAAGTYTIEVTHKGTLLNSSQDFSLIVTAPDFSLSNDEFLSKNFKVWPNPVKDQLYYSFKSVSQGDVNIEITDINGRLVYKNTDKSLSSFISGSIDMSSFSKGIYFVKIRQGNFVQTEKIVH